jgi:hypothetical protein
MTDVVTNAPTAPPPQPAATDVPASTGEEVAALAQPENIEKYVEQRREDDLSPEERKKTQSEHRLSRYDRLKAARDKAQAEAAELRQQLEGRAEEQTAEPQGPRDVEPQSQEQAQEQEWQPQGQPQEQPAEDYAKWAADHEQKLRDVGAFSARERLLKQVLPDYDAKLAEVNDVPLPAHVVDQIRKSEYGPVLAYHLASDFEGLEILYQLQTMSPLDATKLIAKMEAVVEMGARAGQSGSGRAAGADHDAGATADAAAQGRCRSDASGGSTCRI